MIYSYVLVLVLDVCCYNFLFCCRNPSSSDRANSAVRHVAVQWPPYDVNRQQYLVIGTASYAN